MKNKIKIIDVNILSSYMGKWLTVFVAVFVVGVTISALLSRGGSTERNIVTIGVPQGRTPDDAARLYGPLRTLIVRETRRPVVVTPQAGEWSADLDLYVMPIHEFVRQADRLALVPIYEVNRTGRPTDYAILIVRSDDASVDIAQLSAREVVFTDRYAINGFWVQAAAMMKSGFVLPMDANQIHFAGVGEDVSRVIFSVLYGEYRVGACRLSDLVSMTERGVIRGGELRVLSKFNALPERVIGAHEREAPYYRDKLASLGRDLAQVPAATSDDTIELLKALGFRGLQPVGPARIESAREAYRAVEKLFLTAQTQ